MKTLEVILDKVHADGRIAQDLNKNEIIDVLEVIAQNILEKKTTMLDANTLLAIRHQFMSPGQRIFDYNKNASELAMAASAMGKIKSDKKAESSSKNGKDIRPHIVKIEHFESVFPYKLINNEYKVKFDLVINGKNTTYNPDYWCPELDCFIECVTSKPNISEQGPKWQKAIEDGHKLRVFWWEGNELERFINLKKGDR